MNSELLNGQECGGAPGFGYSEANRVPSQQRTLDEIHGASCGTTYIPTGVYGAAGATSVGISTAPSATGTIRITNGPDSATLVQVVGSNLLVMADAQNNGPLDQALF